MCEIPRETSAHACLVLKLLPVFPVESQASLAGQTAYFKKMELDLDSLINLMVS